MLLIANYEGRSGTEQSAKLLAQRENGLRAIIEGIKIVEANHDIHTCRIKFLAKYVRRATT